MQPVDINLQRKKAVGASAASVSHTQQTNLTLCAILCTVQSATHFNAI